MVAIGIFSLMTTVLAACFSEALTVLRRTSGRDSAAREMRKARSSLQRDLGPGKPDQMTLLDLPDHLGGGGKDGQALCFLSPVDPNTGQIARTPDGLPLWQTNILYYLVVPNLHDQTFGMHCQGIAGPGGYDDACPHKMLIRKVIRTSPAAPETLLTNLTPYLTRPDGFNLSAMSSEANVLEVKAVAVNLLTLRCGFNLQVPRQFEMEARATDIQTASRKYPIGSASLTTTPVTLALPFSTLLKN